MSVAAKDVARPDRPDHPNHLRLADEDRLRADCYRVLSRLFAAPPDTALLAGLAASASGTDDELGRSWNALCVAAGAGGAAEEYADLFLAVGAPKVFLYGAWHRSGALMDMALVRLRADLARLGLARRVESREPEDHVAAVLEVMGLLVEEGDSANQAEFFSRHLAPWYPAFCGVVEAQPEAPFYAAVARFGRGFLNAEDDLLTP
jgi:TorA maturation chaperone TorD